MLKYKIYGSPNSNSGNSMRIYWFFCTLVAISLILGQISCLELMRQMGLVPREIGTLYVTKEDKYYILSWLSPSQMIHDETRIEIWSYQVDRTAIEWVCKASKHCKEIKIADKRKTAAGIQEKNSEHWCCFKITWYLGGKILGQTVCKGLDNSIRDFGSCIIRDKTVRWTDIWWKILLVVYIIVVFARLQQPPEEEFAVIRRRQEPEAGIPNIVELEDEQQGILEDDVEMHELEGGHFKDRLLKKKHVLQCHVKMDERMDYFGFLSAEEIESIKNTLDVDTKVGVLIDIIFNKGYTAYWKFLSALRSSNQRKLATFLETPGILQLRVKEEGVDPMSADIYQIAVNHYLEGLRENDVRSLTFLNFLRKHGIRIEWIYRGSVVFVLRFQDSKSLKQFKECHDNGILADLLKKELLPETIPTRNYMALDLSDSDFQQCKEDLERLEGIAFPDWKVSLKNKRKRLAEDLIYEGVLLFLYAAGIVNDETRSLILSETTPVEKCVALIDLVIKEGSWAFVLFVEALDETGQEHLATVLNYGTKGPMPMDEDHKKRIVQNIWKLSNNLNIDEEFVCALRARNVLTTFDCQRLASEKTPLEKSEKLFLIVKSKSDRCFDELCEALCETNRHHLGKLLDGCDHVISPVHSPVRTSQIARLRTYFYPSRILAIEMNHEHMKIGTAGVVLGIIISAVAFNGYTYFFANNEGNDIRGH